MIPEKVDEMLRSYRDCVGRCSHIDALILAKQRQIERLRETIVEDSVKTTSSLTVMPRGGGISDPVAALAVKVASGFETDEIMDLRRELKTLEEEREDKSLTIVFVDAWLQSLNDRQRFVIKRHVIDSEYWRVVLVEFKNQFGEEYSLQGLKRIQGTALSKIYEIAE